MTEPLPRHPRILNIRTGADDDTRAGQACLGSMYAQTSRGLLRRAEIDLVVEPDLFWFQGHFPERPTLPGVVQLDWALDFARRHLGLTVPAARCFQVKYKAVISPDTRLTLVLALHPTASGRRLTFEYRRDGEVYSTGSVTLEAA